MDIELVFIESVNESRRKEGILKVSAVFVTTAAIISPPPLFHLLKLLTS